MIVFNSFISPHIYNGCARIRRLVWVE